MAAFASKYSVELVNASGALLADLTGRARNRRIIQSRNEAEEITWELDLNEFQAYCATINVNPNLILVPGYTEVRVKRLGTYLCGGQIIYSYPHVSASDQSITIRATGFLNMFLKRYTGTTSAGTVAETYTSANGNALSRQDLAWSLINQSQALTYGNYGITRGITAGSTTTYDKTYSRTNIKNALQDMTNLQTAPIDIEFTYDKKFNCYASMGSTRNDISFDFPGGNIIDIGAPNDATNISNEVIGLGQGTGIAQTVVYADNATSQAAYYLRQDVYITNGSDNTDNGVTDATNAELAARGIPIIIPNIILDGSVAPYVTDYGIGDRVGIKASGHSMFTNINGFYRIEKRTIEIDDNDRETVTLEVTPV